MIGHGSSRKKRQEREGSASIKERWVKKDLFAQRGTGGRAADKHVTVQQAG